MSPYLGGEGSAAHTALHAVLGCAGGAASGGECGAGALGASAGVVLNSVLDQASRTEGLDPSEKDARANLVASLVAGVAQAMGADSAQAATAAQVETLFNRQLPPDERQWARDNAGKFAQFYKDQTGKGITADQAEQMLLGNGYRLVDAAASKGPGGDATAVAFISQNERVFHATSEEYTSPFMYGNKDGSLTPEQKALPGSTANPAAGLAVAGGLVTAGLGPEIVAGGTAAVSYAKDLYAAYKAAQAAYSLTTAAITGSGTAAGVYTGVAVGAATVDAMVHGASFGDSFNQRFSPVGLATAVTVGAYSKIFTTSMFQWAGIPNSIQNITTIPGIVIRGNQLAIGQTAGKAAQAIANSGDPKKK